MNETDTERYIRKVPNIESFEEFRSYITGMVSDAYQALSGVAEDHDRGMEQTDPDTPYTGKNTAAQVKEVEIYGSSDLLEPRRDPHIEEDFDFRLTFQYSNFPVIHSLEAELAFNDERISEEEQELYQEALEEAGFEAR